MPKQRYLKAVALDDEEFEDHDVVYIVFAKSAPDHPKFLGLAMAKTYDDVVAQFGNGLEIQPATVLVIPDGLADRREKLIEERNAAMEEFSALHERLKQLNHKLDSKDY